MAKMTLKAARINAGFTQKEAAESLGVSNKTLSHWEAGIATPKVKKAYEICDLYKVALNDLIF